MELGKAIDTQIRKWNLQARSKAALDTSRIKTKRSKSNRKSEHEKFVIPA